MKNIYLWTVFLMFTVVGFISCKSSPKPSSQPVSKPPKAVKKAGPEKTNPENMIMNSRKIAVYEGVYRGPSDTSISHLKNYKRVFSVYKKTSAAEDQAEGILLTAPLYDMLTEYILKHNLLGLDGLNGINKKFSKNEPVYLFKVAVSNQPPAGYFSDVRQALSSFETLGVFFMMESYPSELSKTVDRKIRELKMR